MKKTKTKLISSVTVLLICFAMLIGSTFAWFTDSASTGVNKIQAGTLDIEIVDEAGNPVDGLDWVKADGAPTNEEVLWEPGATYKLPEFYVKNKGSLALKYKVVISGIGGDQKLNKVITWTIKHGQDVLYDSYTGLYTEFDLQPGSKDEKPITVQGKMSETASNDYQGLSIDGITVTVLARQLSSENDSFNNIYDVNSDYDLTVWDGSIDTSLFLDESGNYIDSEEYEIKTAAQLAGLEKAVNDLGKNFAGKTIKLASDINLSNISWTPIAQTGATSFEGTFNGNNHTIRNLYINTESIVESMYATGLFGWVENNSAVIKNLNIDNATVYGHHYVGTIAGYLSGNVIIDSCNVNNSTVKATPALIDGVYDNGDKVGGLIGYINNNTISNCSVINSEIYAFRDAHQIIGKCANNSNITHCTTDSVSVQAIVWDKGYSDPSHYCGENISAEAY